MTQLRIFNDGDVTKPEPVVYLKLKRAGENVVVQACDEDGNDASCGCLLKIFSDGTFTRLAASELNGMPFKARLSCIDF